METTYESRRLQAGRDHNGNQKHRQLDIKHTTVDYRLSRITETQVMYDEETERTHKVVVERRPDMRVSTVVTVCRQHGVIRLYGTQGRA